MRRLMIALIAILSALAVPAVAAARIIDSGNPTVSKNQTVNDDVYMTGDTVVVAGTVNGDVYAAGKTITITGAVNGDVLAAAQEITITGKVKGSVRAAASTTTLRGATIGGSVSDFSQQFQIDAKSSIGGGLNFAAASATVAAPIVRGVMAAGSMITVDSPIGKDVTVAAQRLVLGDQARVGGSVITYNNTQMERQSGSQVSGDVREYHGHSQPASGLAHRAHILEVIWSTLALYVLGCVLLWLLPGRIVMAATAVRTGFWRTLGWGALAFLLIIPLVVILAVTLIGLPLAVLTVAVFALGLYLAKFVVGLAIGTWVAARAQWRPNPYADVIIGLILLTILGLIPVVGGFVQLVVLVSGLGSLVIALWRHRRPQAPRPVSVQPQT